MLYSNAALCVRYLLIKTSYLLYYVKVVEDRPTLSVCDKDVAILTYFTNLLIIIIVIIIFA